MVRAGRLPSKKPTSRLFLALEHEPEVDRQSTPGRQEGLDGFDEDRDVALVVARAAGQDAMPDHGRLERRRGPFGERVRRLDVVVPIDDDGGCAGRAEPVGVDHGVAARLRHVDMVETRGPEPLAEPLGGAMDVGRERRIGGHARDPQEVAERGDPPLATGGQVRLDGGLDLSHASSRGSDPCQPIVAAWRRRRCRGPGDRPGLPESTNGPRGPFVRCLGGPSPRSLRSGRGSASGWVPDRSRPER